MKYLFLPRFSPRKHVWEKRYNFSNYCYDIIVQISVVLIFSFLNLVIICHTHAVNCKNVHLLLHKNQPSKTYFTKFVTWNRGCVKISILCVVHSLFWWNWPIVESYKMSISIEHDLNELAPLILMLFPWITSIILSKQLESIQYQHQFNFKTSSTNYNALLKKNSFRGL